MYTVAREKTESATLLSSHHMSHALRLFFLFTFVVECGMTSTAEEYTSWITASYCPTLAHSREKK